MTPATLRDKMNSLYRRIHGSAPDKYAAKAEWWYWHAKESVNPSEALRYAVNQRRLYKDMVARPEHYRIKPIGMTDYQWSQR